MMAPSLQETLYHYEALPKGEKQAHWDVYLTALRLHGVILSTKHVPVTASCFRSSFLPSRSYAVESKSASTKSCVHLWLGV